MARGRRPHEHGPRLYKRGRYWYADTRPWGGERTVLRNPKAPGWPDEGEKTEDRDIAERWKWAYVDRLRGETRDRLLGREKGRTLGELADAFLEHRENTAIPSTFQATRTCIRRLLHHIGRDVPVSRILAQRTARDPAGFAYLQDMFNAMLARGYAIGTLYTTRDFVSALFGWGGVDPNPARKVELPPRHQPEDPFAWTDDDLDVLRRVADELDRERGRPPSMRLLMELGVGTGCRAGELMALKWSDFNRRTDTLRVVRQVSQSTGRITALKGKLARTALVLPSWWEWHHPKDGWVVAGPDGERLTVHVARRMVEKWIERADRGGSGLHDLRRTYGRVFLERGGWLDELQRSLGHKSLATTERQYGRFQGERAAEFARARIYGEGRLRVPG